MDRLLNNLEENLIAITGERMRLDEININKLPLFEIKPATQEEWVQLVLEKNIKNTIL